MPVRMVFCSLSGKLSGLMVTSADLPSELNSIERGSQRCFSMIVLPDMLLNSSADCNLLLSESLQYKNQSIVKPFKLSGKSPAEYDEHVDSPGDELGGKRTG